MTESPINSKGVPCVMVLSFSSYAKRYLPVAGLVAADVPFFCPFRAFPSCSFTQGVALG